MTFPPRFRSLPLRRIFRMRRVPIRPLPFS
jgi:hypothetical protein